MPAEDQRDHAGLAPHATWDLRGSPPQNDDDRAGEGAERTKQGSPKAVGRLGLEPRTRGFMIRFAGLVLSSADIPCHLPN
jgi:hypothetical protein